MLLQSVTPKAVPARERMRILSSDTSLFLANVNEVTGKGFPSVTARAMTANLHKLLCTSKEFLMLSSGLEVSGRIESDYHHK